MTRAPNRTGYDADHGDRVAGNGRKLINSTVTEPLPQSIDMTSGVW
jgi:hypothetical protein